jgi:hypothetical protein
VHEPAAAYSAPIAAPATDVIRNDRTAGTVAGDYAVLPNLSGWWRGPLTETNPLGMTTYNMALKITANPPWTNVFTGTMSDGNGSTSNFVGTLSKSGEIVINVDRPPGFMLFQLVGQLETTNRMAGTLTIMDTYGGTTTGDFTFTRGKPADIVATSLRWNPKAGGLTLRYDILRANLPSDPPLDVGLYWASGRTQNDAISRISTGNPIPSQRKMGSYTYNVPGWRLRDAPPGTTHILLVVDPDNQLSDADPRNNVFALQDVVVNYKTDARQVLSEYTVGIIKDALRYAGQKSGFITSTYRTPRDQAQAMYNNILKNGAASQYALYGAAGEAVIDAFVAARAEYNKARKQDPSTPKPDYVSIMEAKIIEVGPGNVSKHCSESYSQLQVVDISYSRITNAAMFHRALASDSQIVGTAPANGGGRISKLLDPLTKPKDPTFHIEVPQT